MPVTQGKQRLTRHDFVALRSLARGNWVQGQLIEWKHNRTWSFVPYPSEALDAVFKLQALGLVEQGICCKVCNRETFYLTERGLEIAKRLIKPKSKSDEKVAQIHRNPSLILGIGSRVGKVFRARLFRW